MPRSVKRLASQHLAEWLAVRRRKPLVIRGARQVGKTWLVRELARAAQRRLVEINFERDPSAVRWFEENDPRHIVSEVSLARDVEVTPRASLLFLDEIQAAPSVLSKLRWFAEEMPELPVVAAGSLLEFALAKPAASMPVGRVGYFSVPPLSFREFLEAHGQGRLVSRLEEWSSSTALSATAHEKATEWFERFAMVGGMPAVVAADAEGEGPRTVRTLQSDLASTYRDDFAKYAARIDPRHLDLVLQGVVRVLGGKFVASKVGEGLQHQPVYRALELLGQARLCHEIVHTAANGLPLGGEVNPRLRTYLMLDVGLAHAWLGMAAGQRFPEWRQLAPKVRGQLTEQLVGQQLHALTADPDGTTRLYYWQREGGRPGQIHYVASFGTRIVPIEVKSGAAGAMKSLHQFMFDKGLRLAVRFDANPPSLQDVDVKTTHGDPVKYRLLNLPRYLAWRVGELVGQAGRRRGKRR